MFSQTIRIRIWIITKQSHAGVQGHKANRLEGPHLQLIVKVSSESVGLWISLGFQSKRGKMLFFSVEICIYLLLVYKLLRYLI